MKIFSLIFFLATLVQACLVKPDSERNLLPQQENQEPTDPTLLENITFAKIRPIIVNNCSASGCHGAGGSPDYIDLANGQATFDSQRDELLRRLYNLPRNHFEYMPKGGVSWTSEADKNLIKLYLEQL
jgi:uncharacterized membrane protein